jgi:large subunit ribosomal protein L5
MATKQQTKGAPGKGGKGNAPGNKNNPAPKGGGAKGGAAKGGAAGKAGASKKSGGAATRERTKVDHTGRDKPVPAPRLKGYYNETVRPRLAKQFSLANPHQIPNLTKIVVNVGVGEAVKNARALDQVVETLEIITGQRPVRKKAKKSIANFGLREGQEIGAAVTLRGARMWEFLDRFISVSVPRIRDFRGFGTRSFDGRGNYSLGVKEQMIFPEINYDMVEQTHGMDITFVTTAGRDDQALALLRELGFPFRGEEKPIVPQL